MFDKSISENRTFYYSNIKYKIIKLQCVRGTFFIPNTPK
jgi:hypothetical protein